VRAWCEHRQRARPAVSVRSPPFGTANLQPPWRLEHEVNRASAQLKLGNVTVKPCRFVSSRGHVTELQTRSAADRSLIVNASFTL
jgi:hypothetical protein